LRNFKTTKNKKKKMGNKYCKKGEKTFSTQANKKKHEKKEVLNFLSFVPHMRKTTLPMLVNFLIP
jgi:hypothetical protein